MAIRIVKHLGMAAGVTLALWLGAVPAHALSQARQAGYLYLSPVPSAPYVSAQTRFVLLRLEDVSPAQIENLATDFVTVTGAVSGVHPGTVKVARDGRTVIFEMTTDFNMSELVTVSLNPQIHPSATGTLAPYSYQFAVTAPMPGVLPPGMLIEPLYPALTNLPAQALLALPLEPPLPADPGPGPEATGGSAIGAPIIMPNGVSVPRDFPKVVLTVKNNPEPGYLFLENGFTGNAPPYTLILDNNGFPIWYRRIRVWDFKIQENGTITWCVDRPGGFLSYDQDFNYLKTYHTVNGYVTDYHEMKVLEDGAYLMLGSRTNAVDLSPYVSGLGVRMVIEGVLQEFTPAGELIFQCRGWDLFDIRDNSGYTDFPHMNSIDIDEDGHILLSSRHMLEVTKIDRNTGDVIWRLSGLKSSFTFPNDPWNGFVGQHDINALGDGRYTVFANTGGDWTQESRAVEFELDLTHMTATRVWEFRDTPLKFAHWMGNAQRLPGGNTLINFVRPYYPAIVEVDSNGVKQLEMTLNPNSDHYRIFRFPWTGVVAAPYLTAELQADNVALVFNKFGDKTVDHYRIYGGTDALPTTLLATSTTTLEHVTNVVNGVRNYFRVTAVSTNGVESDYSNVESLVVNISMPGQNMVSNGSFAWGTLAWTWKVTPPASAQWNVTGERSQFEIANGGTYLSDIQLIQSGLSLISGAEYIFEFDAWAEAPRALEARVEANDGGGANYSGIAPFAITPLTNHFKFTFRMLAPSDDDARLVFNAGAIPHDVFIDNVSLRQRLFAPGDFDKDGCVGFHDLEVLAAQWQESPGTWTSDLNRDGKVGFADFVRFSGSWTAGGACP